MDRNHLVDVVVKQHIPKYNIEFNRNVYDDICNTVNSLEDDYIKSFRIDDLASGIAKYLAKKYKTTLKPIAKSKQIVLPQKYSHAEANRIINQIPNYKQQQISRKIEKSNTELKSMTDNVSIDEWLHKEIGTTSEIPEDTRNIQNKQSNTEFNQGIKVNIKDILGITSYTDLQKLFNPETLYRKCYVVLDSRNRLYSESTNTSFRWIFSDSLNIQQGIVNSIAMPRDVISIKMYQPVFPRVDDLDYDTNRVSILIQEFNTQAFVASESRKYHYLTRIVDNTGAVPARTHIELQTEDYADGTFNFKQSITTINSFTLTFGNPINLISIPDDLVNVTFTTYGIVTEITTPTAHNLATSDIVYFTSFTTLAPAADNTAITEMNNPFGLVINVTSATTFTVQVNTTTITGIVNLTIPCYYGRYQFIIPLELTYKTY